MTSLTVIWDKTDAIKAVEKTVGAFGGLNILISNAAQQWLDDAGADFTGQTLHPKDGMVVGASRHSDS